jgi:hypothetical protein
MSIGGCRLYSDDAHAAGDRLELELFLPRETTIICRVEVVWIDELPAGAPALFDVGMKFVQIADVDKRTLSGVLVAD